MEKSLAEGSQTFEADIARLIAEGVITRDEGLAYADSPTNLLWRLQNDTAPQSQAPTPARSEADDGASFTEITLDVRDERQHRHRAATRLRAMRRRPRDAVPPRPAPAAEALIAASLIARARSRPTTAAARH